MKVLVIGYVWPEPASSAAGGRMLGFLRLFQRWGWTVDFSTPAAESPYAFDLESIGVNRHRIELNHSSFDGFVKNLRPDLVLFDRFMMEEQFGWRVAEQCPGSLRLLDTVDLHFLRQARHGALKENREVAKNDFRSDFALREIASILRSDMSLIISEFEMELLLGEFKIDPALLRYVPLLADALSQESQQAWPGFAARNDFLFIGNFLHEPNWDAVLFLKNTLWPLLRKCAPGASLRVYGAYPSAKVTQLHRPSEGFLVEGRAEDARKVMSKARVCLAPLRFGAGVKGKLVEAMECGTPSVTTDIGAEGLTGGLPWNGAIANTPDEFVSAAAALYADETKWREAQDRGIAIINSRNARGLFEPDLKRDLEARLAGLPTHRENNFLGMLLQHHTLHSARYMSRWMEEKNRGVKN